LIINMGENIYKKRPDVHICKTCWDVYPQLLKKIKINRKEKILDAGCGEGRLAVFLRIPQLFGFDLSIKAVKEAEKKGYKKVIIGEMKSFPFEDKEFDKSISTQVFQYLENPDKAFSEMVRVSKSQVIITVPNLKWFYIKSKFSRGFKKDYERILKEINFTGKKFLIDLSKGGMESLEISYISNKFGILRNIFGNFLASEVVGVYNLK